MPNLFPKLTIASGEVQKEKPESELSQDLRTLYETIPICLDGENPDPKAPLFGRIVRVDLPPREGEGPVYSHTEFHVYINSQSANATENFDQGVRNDQHNIDDLTRANLAQIPLLVYTVTPSYEKSSVNQTPFKKVVANLPLPTKAMPLERYTLIGETASEIPMESERLLTDILGKAKQQVTGATDIYGILDDFAKEMGSKVSRRKFLGQVRDSAVVLTTSALISGASFFEIGRWFESRFGIKTAEITDSDREKLGPYDLLDFAEVYNEYNRLSKLVAGIALEPSVVSPLRRWITTINRVLNGEITETNNPEVMELTAGWAYNDSTRVELSKEMIESFIDQVRIDTSEVPDNPEEIRGHLKTLARVFPHVVYMMGFDLKMIPLNKYGYVGQYNPITGQTTLPTISGEGGSLSSFFYVALHEADHAIDIDPERVKGITGRQAFAQYHREQLHFAGEIIHDFLTTEPPSGLLGLTEILQINQSSLKDREPNNLIRLALQFEKQYLKGDSSSPVYKDQNYQVLMEYDTLESLTERVNLGIRWLINSGNAITAKYYNAPEGDKGSALTSSEKSFLQELNETREVHNFVNSVIHRLSDPPSSKGEMCLAQSLDGQTPDRFRDQTHMQFTRKAKIWSNLPDGWAFHDIHFALGTIAPEQAEQLLTREQLFVYHLERLGAKKLLTQSKEIRPGVKTDHYSLYSLPYTKESDEVLIALAFLNPQEAKEQAKHCLMLSVPRTEYERWEIIPSPQTESGYSFGVGGGKQVNITTGFGSSGMFDIDITAGLTDPTNTETVEIPAVALSLANGHTTQTLTPSGRTSVILNPGYFGLVLESSTSQSNTDITGRVRNGVGMIVQTPYQRNIFALDGTFGHENLASRTALMTESSTGPVAIVMGTTDQSRSPLGSKLLGCGELPTQLRDTVQVNINSLVPDDVDTVSLSVGNSTRYTLTAKFSPSDRADIKQWFEFIRTNSTSILQTKLQTVQVEVPTINGGYQFENQLYLNLTLYNPDGTRRHMGRYQLLT